MRRYSSEQAVLFEDVSDARLVKSILRMPKVDLHRHLTGSIDAAMAVRIASEYGVELPTWISSELQDLLCSRPKAKSLEGYFSPWVVLNRLFVSVQAIHDIVLEVIRKASEDNVVYLELRMGPQGFLGQGEFSFREFAETVAASLAEAEARFPVPARCILGLPRHVFGRIPVGTRTKMFARIVSTISDLRPHCFVGVDLNGVETAAAAEEFAVFFKVARDHGFGLTVHAGECGSASSVEYAVRELHAARIGHGLAGAASSSVRRMLAESQCALEICPTSNEVLGVVHSVRDLPLVVLRECGVPIALCSDNPARCNTSLSEELYKVARAFGLSLGDIMEMNRTALAHSFADPHTKEVVRTRVQLMVRGALGDESDSYPFEAEGAGTGSE